MSVVPVCCGSLLQRCKASCETCDLDRRRRRGAAAAPGGSCGRGPWDGPSGEAGESYGVAKREMLPGVEHRQSRSLHNRCENSHRPTRQRARRLQGFTSPGRVQPFLAAYGLIAPHFRPSRHLLSASEYRQEMAKRFKSWTEMTGTERAASREGEARGVALTRLMRVSASIP